MPLSAFSLRSRAIAAGTVGAILVAVIYILPTILIRHSVGAAGLRYLPVTVAADFDEAEIYAPQVENVAHGDYRTGDPTLTNHRADSGLLPPLGAWVLGTLARPFGLTAFWTWKDALFPPLIFLIFFGISYRATRRPFLSLGLALIPTFFREIISYLPWSTGAEFKTWFANVLPTVPSGIFNTRPALARVFTPGFTFIPLGLWTLLFFRAATQKTYSSALAPGILLGLLTYSYPFDAIAAGFVTAVYLVILLGKKQFGDFKRHLTGTLLAAVVALPAALALRAASHLPQYAELLDRTGLEIGRSLRYSHIPHYALWIAAGIFLLRRAGDDASRRAAAAVFLAAPLILNLQIVTGSVPQPWHFLTYSLAIPLFAAALYLAGALGDVIESRVPWAPRAATVLVALLAISILTRNIQVAAGYSREQWRRYAATPSMVAALEKIRSTVPTDRVVLTPERATNALLLAYTPASVVTPPNGVVSSASNRELVERAVFAQKLFGFSDEAVREQFRNETIAGILHYGIYPTTPDRTYDANVRYRPDLDALLEAALATYRTRQSELRGRYPFDYVFVGPDEVRDFHPDLKNIAPCLAPVFHADLVDVYARC